jgi:hypothetical protein
MKVISTSLLASTAILVLAVWASVATPSGADQGGLPSGAGQGACLPQNAQTLAADHAARVFSWHGSVYGCLEATGTRLKLGGAGICNLPPGRAGPVRLSGAIVAYGLESCGVDTGSSLVVVRNLATTTRTAEVSAGTLPLGPESYVSVASLVLRHNGHVGWIATDSSLVGQHPTTYEVHRFTAGKSSLLDSGTAIHPGSLRLAGARMTWQNGTQKRSASLG